MSVVNVPALSGSAPNYAATIASTALPALTDTFSSAAITIAATTPSIEIRNTNTTPGNFGSIGFFNDTNTFIAALAAKALVHGASGNAELHFMTSNNGTPVIGFILGITGIATHTNVVRGTTSNATAPSYSFNADTGSGMYSGGVGSLDFSVSGVHQFNILPTAAAVNYLSVTGSIASNAAGPTISALGTDTNIPVSLHPKGTSPAQTTGDFFINTTGKGLRIAEGANAKMGIAILSGGTFVVNTTALNSNSRVFLTTQIPGGTPGFVYVSARSNTVSFTILSSSGADTSSVAWLIIDQ